MTTNREKFTTAQLATLDQLLAEYDPVVTDFAAQAAEQVRVDGRQIGTAAIADHLAKHLNVDQLASVAAIALVRLTPEERDR